MVAGLQGPSLLQMLVEHSLLGELVVVGLGEAAQKKFNQVSMKCTGRENYAVKKRIKKEEQV